MPWTSPSAYSCQAAIAPRRAQGRRAAPPARSEHGLARDHHPSQVDPVGDRAADEGERGDGERLHERERADGDRRVGQLEHQPVRRDLLHPRADERDRRCRRSRAGSCGAAGGCRRCVSPSALSGAAERATAHATAVAARSIGIAEHEDAVALLGDGDRLGHDDVRRRAGRAGAPAGRSGRSMNQSRPTGSPAATGSPGSSIASNIPSSGETTIVARVAAVEDHGGRQAERGARLHLALEHADVAQHVVEPAPGEPVHRRRDASAAAELGRDHELALALRLDGQQPVAVDVDVEEVPVASSTPPSPRASPCAARGRRRRACASRGGTRRCARPSACRSRRRRAGRARS